jgi:hypothetical protein
MLATGAPVLARGGGRLLLRGDLLLSLDLGFVSLIFTSSLVRVLGGPVAVPLGVLLLELARVEQHQGRQLDSAPRGIDGAVEAFGHEVRDEAAVIEMGVGQDDRVQRRRVVGEGNSVADDLVRTSLEHAAVDQDAGSIGDEEELGTGDGVGSAEEVDFHVRILPSWRLERAPSAARRPRDRSRRTCGAYTDRGSL